MLSGKSMVRSRKSRPAAVAAASLVCAATAWARAAGVARRPRRGGRRQGAAGRRGSRCRAGARAAGGALPNGADLRFRGVEGSLPDVLGSIRYDDEQMAARFLAMFTKLGTPRRGHGPSVRRWWTSSPSARRRWPSSTPTRPSIVRTVGMCQASPTTLTTRPGPVSTCSVRP